MIFLVIILLVILAILLFILLIPLVIEIDTSENVYMVRLGGVASVWPGWEDDTFCLYVKVPFKRFRITKFRSSKKADRKNTEKKDRLTRETSRSTSAPSLKRIMAVIRSIRISNFRLEVDTDDFARNGQLYPVFFLINQAGLNCSVNFHGENHLSFTASSSLLRMGWAWIRSA